MNTAVAKNDAGKEMHDYLQTKKAEIQKAAGRVMDADTLLRVVLNSMIKNQTLMKCTQASMALAVLDAAAFGLFPNSLTNEGHLVPFYNNKKKQYECVFIVGYRGLIKMAVASGVVKDVKVRKVYENDQFEYAYGLDEYLRHVPANADRGEFKACYAVLDYGEGNKGFEVLTAEDAVAHGLRFSKSQKEGKLYGPWKDDLPAMAMKTVVRQALKYAPVSPLSEKLFMAMGQDEKAEAGYIDIDIVPEDDIPDVKAINEGSMDSDRAFPSLRKEEEESLLEVMAENNYSMQNFMDGLEIGLDIKSKEGLTSELFMKAMAIAAKDADPAKMAEEASKK